LHLGFLRLALVQGLADRTGCAASGTTLIVTLHQDIVPAGASDDLVPLVPGYSFCALVPEQYLPASVGDRDARLQAVQHGAEDLWILEFGHGEF
jgi:hypothetical protein